MNAKQKWCLLLSFLYLLNIVGLTINVHFCQNSLQTVNFSQPVSICPHCKMPVKKSSNSCCKDNTIVIKSNEKAQLTDKISLPSIPSFAIAWMEVHFPFLAPLRYSLSANDLFFNVFQFYRKISLHQLISVFRI